MSAPYPSVVTPQRSGWSGLRISGVVLSVLSVIVGTVCGIQLVVKIATPAAHLLQARESATPFDTFFSLDEGAQSVYERVGRTASSSSPPTIGPGDITVIGPAGQVPVRGISYDESIDLGTGHFVAVARFDAPTSGQYRVQIQNGGTTVVVGPSLLSGVSRAGGWLVGTLLCALGLLVGLGLLIASFVRRRPRPAVAGAGPAPGMAQQPAYPPQPATVAGWYPDPQAPQQLRYWDGAGWTAHVQPRS